MKKYRDFLDKEVLNGSEVRQMLGNISNDKLLLFIDQGLPRRKKEGRQPYYLASEVDKWLKCED